MHNSALLFKQFQLKNFSLFLITFFFLAFSACTSQEKVQEEVVEPVEDILAIDTGMFTCSLQEVNEQEIRNSIESYFSSIEPIDSLNYSDTTIIESALQRLYELNDFNPLWIFDSRADSALAAIQPQNHGLREEDVHLDSLLSAIGMTVNVQHTRRSLYESDWAKIDITYSRALLWWGKVLAHGKVDPNTVNEIWNYTPKEINPPLEQELSKAAEGNRLSQYIQALAPKSDYYWAIQQEFESAINQQNQNSSRMDSLFKTPIQLNGVSKLVPGDSNKVVVEIAKRLHALDYATDYKPDTISDYIYSENIQEAVALFQQAHGLNPDSVIGKSTLAMLNLTPSQRKDAMRCALERLRWVDHYLQGDYVLVNAPQFKVYYVKNDSIIWQSRVVIGTTWSKTPNLTASIERLVFNPTWTVPYSISSREILPKLQKDSMHLVKQNMNLLDRSGEIIASTSVDYSQYDRDNFPYIIRQKPNASNSLGLVKYHMPNPYYIFMHDTPNKRFFNKDQRTYSHGCIRLENPFELAEILLHDTPEWNPDTIQAILDTGKTTNYSLAEPLPIHVLYLSYFIDAAGNQYILNDVYKRDEKLLEFLKH